MLRVQIAENVPLSAFSSWPSGGDLAAHRISFEPFLPTFNSSARRPLGRILSSISVLELVGFDAVLYALTSPAARGSISVASLHRTAHSQIVDLFSNSYWR